MLGVGVGSLVNAVASGLAAFKSMAPTSPEGAKPTKARPSSPMTSPSGSCPFAASKPSRVVGALLGGASGVEASTGGKVAASLPALASGVPGEEGSLDDEHAASTLARASKNIGIRFMKSPLGRTVRRDW